jgi:GT2 family glycosyltransferase
MRDYVSKTPSVCVVVVNYNSGRLLEKCLNSLAAQTFNHFHTIVVDNCSTDRSIEWLKPIDNQLYLILNSRNVGFAAANNQAIKEADTDWIALLNPDAFPGPTWLSNLMMAAKNFPDNSFFASKLLSNKEPWLLDGAGDDYHLSGRMFRRGHGARAESGSNIPVEVFSSCAASALYRRSALEDVGGFDEDFFCYGEDTDLGFRLRLAGHRCLYVPEAVVYHVGSATTGKNSDFSIYHGHRNLVWVFLKNMPMPLFAVCLPAHLLLNLISLIWFPIIGHGRAILRSKLDAIKGIPLMWRKRRQIQSERRISWKEIWRVLSFRIPLQP